MKELCNKFLNSKRNFLSSDELSERTFNDYVVVGKLLSKYLGKHRPISSLSIAVRVTFFL